MCAPASVWVCRCTCAVVDFGCRTRWGEQIDIAHWTVDLGRTGLVRNDTVNREMETRIGKFAIGSIAMLDYYGLNEKALPGRKVIPGVKLVGKRPQIVSTSAHDMYKLQF